MLNPTIRLAAIALAGTALAAPAAFAQVKLPPTVTMTAYDTGTSGFNIAVAIGKMLKDKYGADVRVLPGRQRRRSPAAAARQPRGDLGDGRRRLLRAGRACSSSRPRSGARSRSRSR